MKKIIRTICMTCIALSFSFSTVCAQDKQKDSIPEYIEIDDSVPLYTAVESQEEEQLPVSGATLAWRDMRPETDPNVTPSRSVTIGLNQYLEVEYPGNEWIYLGEAEETNHVRYYGRKLGRENTTFTLCSKEAGTVLLHFYCIDPLNGTSISDYLEVVVEDRTTGTSKKVTAPSYAKAVPGGQHSNEFDYVTPTVKEVHKEPATPYTLEVPNPPKENTVAVPKTSSSSTKSSGSTSTTSSSTTKPSSSSSATTQASSSSSSAKNTTSTGTTTKPATSSTSTSKSSSSSSTSTTPASTSSSSSRSASSSSTTTTSTATSPATASSSSSTTRSASSGSTSTASPSASSTTRSASSGSTTSSTQSTSSGNTPASASIATGNPTTRSISRSASSPITEDYDTADYDYTDAASSYSDASDSYPSYGSSSGSAASSGITSGPSIAANTGSDYSSLSGSELLEKAHEAYDNAKYAECLSYLEEFFNSSASGIDEALYLQGQALEAPGSSRNIKGALDAYETLVKNYPYSKYWEPANERVIYIKRFYINIR